MTRPSDSIRRLVIQLQDAAYDHGYVDAGDYSYKRYDRAQEKADAAREALLTAIDAALTEILP